MAKKEKKVKEEMKVQEIKMPIKTDYKKCSVPAIVLV